MTAVVLALARVYVAVAAVPGRLVAAHRRLRGGRAGRHGRQGGGR